MLLFIRCDQFERNVSTDLAFRIALILYIKTSYLIKYKNAQRIMTSYTNLYMNEHTRQQLFFRLDWNQKKLINYLLMVQ